ncbi:MAG TPA: SDR family NAD(P)-dependent oxidoreductase, partial [Epulopiscium sp.]|nr:SDR family NAD(P)-dependent oxidoreductase [Candidatus Epulonipiscium sp.]
MNFKDKVVLVTGSSRGIGKAIALKFASLGAIVLINGSKDHEALKATYEEIISLGGKAYMYLCDVSSYEAAKKLFDTSYAQLGRPIDILINNAGICHVGLFTDTTPDMWKNLIDTNLTPIYNCCHLAVPSMVHSHSGCIINTSSIWGNVGASCEVAYSASKGAINSFSKALGKELGPCNIRVHAIACGLIETKMNNCFTQEEKETFIEDVPLCRAGKP